MLTKTSKLNRYSERFSMTDLTTADVWHLSIISLQLHLQLQWSEQQQKLSLREMSRCRVNNIRTWNLRHYHILLKGFHIIFSNNVYFNFTVCFCLCTSTVILQFWEFFFFRDSHWLMIKSNVECQYVSSVKMLICLKNLALHLSDSSVSHNSWIVISVS